jgi:hypothetical protein
MTRTDTSRLLMMGLAAAAVCGAVGAPALAAEHDPGIPRAYETRHGVEGGGDYSDRGMVGGSGSGAESGSDSSRQDPPRDRGITSSPRTGRSADPGMVSGPSSGARAQSFGGWEGRPPYMRYASPERLPFAWAPARRRF